MQLNLLKRLAGQTAVYGLSSIVGRLLNYLLVPIYTRVFLPEEYGIVTDLYAYVGFLIVIFTYGMETAFFRYVKEESNPQEVYSTAFLSLAISSTVFVSLLLCFAQPIATWLQYPQQAHYIIWFACILGLDTLVVIPFAHLRQEEKAIQFASIKLINIATNISLNLLWIVFCPHILANYPQFVDKLPFFSYIYNPSIGIGYIFISNLIASAITLLLLLPQIFTIKLRLNKNIWAKMIVYALPLVVVGFAGIVNEMLDRILLKYLLPYNLTQNIAQIGIYGACYKLSILMTLFIQAFRFAAEPFFFAQAKHNNAPATYAAVLKYFIIIGAFIFLGITLCLDVFKYFIGEKYHDGIGVVPILLMANLFLGIYYNLSIWYKLINKTIIGAYIGLIGAAITIALNIWLIPIIGYFGSAWATLICYMTMTGINYYWGKAHYPIPYPLKDIFVALLLALFLFVIDYVLSAHYTKMTLLSIFSVKSLLLSIYITYILYMEKTGLKKLF